MTTTKATAHLSRTGTEPRARFRDLFAAEWIKLWSLRSMPWVLGLSGLAIIGVNLNAAKRAYDASPAGNPNPVSGYMQTALDVSFVTVAADILMVVAGSVGAIMIVSEYATGMIRTTLAAVPDRRAVLAAKACVLTVVTLSYGTLVAGTSFALDQAVLSGRDVGLSITHPGALRFVAAAALLAPVCALIGMALGVLIRHTATAVVSTGLVLFALPSLFTDTNRWTADVSHAMPLTAWRRLSEVDMTNVFLSQHPATVSGAWITFAAWPVVSTLIAAFVIGRRDL
jgi:ABC-type transport system involved in multi-copper enzyme maturation permease subunit